MSNSKDWAVVTGASSGIGRAFAMELAERGYPVLLVARREDELRRVAAQISTRGGRAEVVAALSPFATTKPAGLGLGLPLARETLERQGGRLLIDSRPGIGTTVRLALPLARKRTARA